MIAAGDPAGGQARNLGFRAALAAHRIDQRGIEKIGAGRRTPFLAMSFDDLEERGGIGRRLELELAEQEIAASAGDPVIVADAEAVGGRIEVESGGRGENARSRPEAEYLPQFRDGRGPEQLQIVGEELLEPLGHLGPVGESTRIAD
ncbi:hypothetical protein [uncultured Bradyrhizobium sp.]|uniref:hypothetical protein n=1 Tax=uncultured Bradyrhizobium sp. TaxID=199684 RepID=UPI00260A1887|nr:hypothetical protein [uncultured Bradyrhizobium sp.]